MSEESTKMQAELLAILRQGMQRMRAEKSVCDLVVLVGSKSFHCHLLLLASVSGYFRSVASGSWEERRSGKVTLRHDDVTEESFGMFLDVLYKSGDDVITMDTVTDVLRTAIYLNVPFLEKYCAEYLSRRLIPKMAVGVWMLAKRYSQPHLADRAFTVALEEIEEVIEGDDILHLPKSMLMNLLSSQTKLSMDEVCKTILRWVAEDLDVRQVYYEDLIPFVCFLQLQPSSLFGLTELSDLPFYKSIYKRIEKTVSFQKIHRTEGTDYRTFLHRCAVVLASDHDSHDATTTPEAFNAFYVELRTQFYPYRLTKPLRPFASKFYFASCVYTNELYVSQRDERETLLMTYVARTGCWKSLPALKKLGLERHSMAGTRNRIYLVGGSAVDCVKHTRQKNIPYYDVVSKTWGQAPVGLPVGVDGPATAVLGHRIYVFGGQDVDHQPLNIVQCVDTLSGQVYQAGTLPFVPREVLAVSNGGTIYLLCDASRVLKMTEDFELADRREKALYDKVNSEEDQPIAASENGNTEASTVGFVNVGVFADGNVLTAYLHGGEMVGCGVVDKYGSFLNDVSIMNLTTGEVTKIRLAFKMAARNMVLHTLVIPRSVLDQATVAELFQNGEKDKWRSDSRLTLKKYRRFRSNPSHSNL